MDNLFQSLSFDATNVGKIIKSSKKKSVWKFIFKNKPCELILNISKFSGNYSIFLNTKLLYKGNRTFDCNFQFKIKLEKNILLIHQINNDYKLIFNKKDFEDYYSKDKKKQVLEKTKEIKNYCSKKYLISDPIKNKKYRHLSLNPNLSNTINDSDLVDKEELKKNILKNFQDSKKSEKKVISKLDKDEINKIYELSNEEDSDNDENEGFNENKKVNRKRFTKDFEEFEDMEIFIFPNDFPRQTPKIKKVVDNVNNEF